MRRICMRIIAIILPLLFVIGMFRVIINNENDFLPGAKEFIFTLNNAPNIMDVITVNLANINDSSNLLKFSFENIDSIQSFFIAIGNLFSFLGTCIMLVVNTLIGVVKWLIWVLKFVFGF